MIRAPKLNPIKKRKIQKGINLTIVLYSFFLRAGFKKDKIWATKIGKTTTSPVATPQLMERLINWKGEVNTILIPLKERRSTRNLIIFS